MRNVYIGLVVLGCILVLLGSGAIGYSRGYKKATHDSYPEVIYMYDFNGDKVPDAEVRLRNGHRLPYTCSAKAGRIICQRPPDGAKRLEDALNTKIPVQAPASAPAPAPRRQPVQNKNPMS